VDIISIVNAQFVYLVEFFQVVKINSKRFFFGGGGLLNFSGTFIGRECEIGVPYVQPGIIHKCFF